MAKVVRGVLVFGLVAGCGSVKDDVKQDAAVDAKSTDAAIDAPAAPRCNPASAFGAPVAISEINTTGYEENAYLSADELTLYFSSTRTGSLGMFDLFMATRSNRTAQWGNIVPVPGTNSAAQERYPMITADGRTLYVLTGASPNYAISVTTRATTSDSFGTLSLVPTINDANHNDESGSILPDNSAMWFSSDRSGNYDLYRSPRINNVFSTPLVVSGTQLITTASEASPVVTPDELTLFFQSDRTGGVGGGDIWMAKRTSVANGFDQPVNVQVLNSSDSEGPTWVSADGCVIYMTRYFGGNYDLYYATRGM